MKTKLRAFLAVVLFAAVADGATTVTTLKVGNYRYAAAISAANLIADNSDRLAADNGDGFTTD